MKVHHHNGVRECSMANTSPVVKPIPHSLERLVPDQLEHDETTGHAALALHIERYQFAARHSLPSRILDIACGVGYGTQILRDEMTQACEVIGVDCSAESIAYAQQRYVREGIRFIVADAMTYDDPQRFDTIVSLETIEHVPDPHRFLFRLRQLLRPGGVLIGSVPTSFTTDANPHHRSDFTERQFRALVEPCGFSVIAILRQVQPFNPLSVLQRKERRLQDLRPRLGQYYITHPRALLGRLWSTLRFGFTNRYVTIAWRHNG
ncbi:MAG: class I SAM-dependent methyltransferase [Nitrospirae bacterium]|nr:MAG: class I SAM-dependent methyltransferase [Nitrospirota bacterium]